LILRRCCAARQSSGSSFFMALGRLRAAWSSGTPSGNSGTRAVMTRMVRSRWVKPCCATPGRACQSRPVRGAWASASASVQGSARQGVPGRASMPPSRPLSGRRSSSRRPASSSSAKCTPCRAVRAALGDLRGSPRARGRSRRRGRDGGDDAPAGPRQLHGRAYPGHTRWRRRRSLDLVEGADILVVERLETRLAEIAGREDAEGQRVLNRFREGLKARDW